MIKRKDRIIKRAFATMICPICKSKLETAGGAMWDAFNYCPKCKWGTSKCHLSDEAIKSLREYYRERPWTNIYVPEARVWKEQTKVKK